MDYYIWKGANNLIKSIQSKTSMLKAIKPYTSFDQLAYIANATLNSTILCVAPLWAQTGENNIRRIQSAQTRAARQITWVRRTRKTQLEHRQTLFEKLGWLNTTQMANQAIISTVNKAINNRSSQEINEICTWRNTQLKRDQHSHQITVVNTTKRTGPNLLDKGSELYYAMPLKLQDNGLKPYQFKKQLKEYIKDNYQLIKH